MPTLADVLDEQTGLDDAATEWLHDLVGDWQLLSDLSFGDLVLWVRRPDEQWVAAAHVRPTTGVGIFVDDLVGRVADHERLPMIQQAFTERRLVPGGHPVWHGDAPVREEAIPVRPRGATQPVAVVTRHTSHASMRTPSRLEVTYLATADALVRMIATGAFPTQAGQTGRRRGAPRVGDGVLRLGSDGAVLYASPNAVSAVHRLGYTGAVVGARLAEVLAPLVDGLDEEQVPVLSGQLPWATEVRNRGASMTVRSIPLSEAGRRTGAVLLVRDVGELRRRERELLTKDATIREIHHRVKNNLQAVAAVLRLQGRRLADPMARAALDDAGRRVATIALVHDTLSHRLDDTIDFGLIAQRGLQAAIDVANRSDARARGRLRGAFGQMRSDDATPLAMVLAELVQNAVEHGLGEDGGVVEVEARRLAADGSPDPAGERLEVEVRDGGPGLPAGFEPGQGGLGLRIVLSLVDDLGGEIAWADDPAGGTVVRFHARLRPMEPLDPEDGAGEAPSDGDPDDGDRGRA
ncbi:sensor histidine kinase [Barrientosiimonas endolithica]|uniref:histidine kinase n=1 Tax=Barrientosiimonas endolithica TaxID=1535208 RepID=A0ABN6YNB9_9MICO|nr:sensor histidine kinase [Barrientosiimonas endolithica]BDZ58828.1 histidine kinase [Barrientosiimonas endolithica]